MDKLRIIGLDDDNHSPCFLCEEGTRFETYKELVDFLCKPHDCGIEVKMFAIVDPIAPSCDLAKYSYGDIDEMFYYLECCGGILPEGITSDRAFNMFWEAANRLCW